MKLASIISVATGAVVLVSSYAQAVSLPRYSTCSDLIAKTVASSLASQNCTVISATLIAANGSIPEYCNVSASVAYGNGDTLNFDLFLPDAANWNGRFMAVGNGGFAGAINDDSTGVAMMVQLETGFAVAGGDAGHLASANNDGVGAPGVYLPFLHNSDQVKAWIHNAIALFTPSAKTLVQAFYGKPPSYSYYNGCSTGGAQGFALAEFYPDMFDGIYAGSPGNYYSHLALSFLWNAVKTQGAAYIPVESLDAITSAVLEECDTLDGVADNMLENPLECKFDINTMSCANSVASTCLTPAQLAATQAIYAGPTSSTSGLSLYPGFNFGSESSWTEQEGVLADAFSIPILQNMVFDNLSYNFLDFNWGSDVEAVDKTVSPYIDETGPDFSKFMASGGKMLVTQGWADQLNAATWPIQQLELMQEAMGGNVSSFFELFMIPGGGHCAANPLFPASPGTYLVNDALLPWVEEGIVPRSVLTMGTDGNTPISRLLCPWPETAKYKGGNTNSSTSYYCA